MQPIAIFFYKKSPAKIPGPRSLQSLYPVFCDNIILYPIPPLRMDKKKFRLIMIFNQFAYFYIRLPAIICCNRLQYEAQKGCNYI